MSEREDRPPWFYPLCIVAFGVYTILIAYGARSGGYADATAKAEANDLYVKEQMDKVGFCEWVKQAEFVQYCTSKNP